MNLSLIYQRDRLFMAMQIVIYAQVRGERKHESTSNLNWFFISAKEEDSGADKSSGTELFAARVSYLH